MPSINGIAAFIETHDGMLPELGQAEFNGGLSCYVPAQSGQQFWLRYVFPHPVSCEAARVDFYVDGQRIDSEFPVLQKGHGSQSIEPLDSRITSQYVQDLGSGDGGPGKFWRRDVFFTLVKMVKARSAKGLMSPEQTLRYGTIECKVYRGERLPETVSTVDSKELSPPPPELYHGFLNGRHISHVSRLGARIETTQRRRHSVRNIDSEESPFAWFKFQYRSREYLEKKFNMGWPKSLPMRDEVCRRLLRMKCAPPGMLERPTGPPLQPTSSNYPLELKTRNPGSDSRSLKGSLEVTIHELENELADAERSGAGDPQLLDDLREQLQGVKGNSEKLRANARGAKETSQVHAQEDSPDGSSKSFSSANSVHANQQQAN